MSRNLWTLYTQHLLFPHLESSLCSVTCALQIQPPAKTSSPDEIPPESAPERMANSGEDQPESVEKPKRSLTEVVKLRGTIAPYLHPAISTISLVWARLLCGIRSRTAHGRKKHYKCIQTSPGNEWLGLAKSAVDLHLSSAPRVFFFSSFLFFSVCFFLCLRVFVCVFLAFVGLGVWFL